MSDSESIPIRPKPKPKHRDKGHAHHKKHNKPHPHPNELHGILRSNALCATVGVLVLVTLAVGISAGVLNGSSGHATNATTEYVSTGGPSNISFSSLSSSTPFSALSSSTAAGPALPLSAATSNIDVFVIKGQSNAQGRGTYLSPSIDVYHGPGSNNLWQFVIGDSFSCNDLYQQTECPSASAHRYAAVPLSSEPLIDAWPSTGSYGNEIGFGITFASSYLTDHPSRILMFLQCSVGGTGFSSGDWIANTGVLWKRCNTATNVMMNTYPLATLKGWLWCQGENDVTGHMTQSVYMQNLIALITADRAQVVGATATTPFNVLSINPYFAQGSATIPYSFPIQKALQSMPSVLPNVTFTWTPGNGLDASYSDTSATYGIAHMNAVAQRLNGVNLYNTWKTAPAVPTAVSWYLGGAGGRTTYTDSFSQLWTNDAYALTNLVGSLVYNTAPSTTPNTTDPTLFQAAVTSQSALTLLLPVASGSYTVFLYWADWLCTAVGCRVFDVWVNQQNCQRSMDVVARAGVGQPFRLSCATVVSAGVVNITVVPSSTSMPLLNAVQVLPPSVTPNRIVI